MKNFLNSKYLKSYKSILFLQTIFFIPFLIDGSISSDWDSYASLASGKILLNEFDYFPSRPPGFPIYELLLAFLSIFSNRLIIIFHFLIGALFTFYIFKMLPNNNQKFLFSLLFFTSNIYLISSFSTIDYLLGTFLGFAFLNNLEKQNYLKAYIFIILSCGIRLSNVIFLFAGLIYLILKFKDFNKTLLFLTAFIPIVLLYLPGYILGGGFCFLNLTNIDHSPVERFGRYFYKQLQFFGVIGSSILIFLFLKNLKKINFWIPNNAAYLLIFISFQLSFLRLPTEKGHLIPAMICFLFFLNELKLNKFLINLVLISSLISNLVAFEFLNPDVPNHASSAQFGFFIDKGYLIKDYEKRQLIGSEYEFHINNAILSIKTAWGEKAPNC